MKACVLFLFGLAVITASAADENAEEKRYPRFITFPDGEGVGHEVDLQDQPDEDLLDELEKDPSKNSVYLLYTRRNPDTPQILVKDDPKSIKSSKFNSRHNTVVIVHGWMGGRDSSVNSKVRDAYLNKEDVNVIVLDWRRVAFANYVTAVRGVPTVGRGLGQFLTFLNKVSGASFKSIHLVGFSLGAHLVGNAGRTLNGKVARITGLDPAGPLWLTNSNKLRAEDAVYVEVIHTDGSYDGLGYGLPLGDVDFFPNGGTSQPGCFTSLCYHSRAYELFAATVSYNHLPGRRCTNPLQIQLNTCRGETLEMGNTDLKKTGSGSYRVNTRRRYPYGPR